MSDGRRQQAAATAGVGAVLVGVGGHVRHLGMDAARASRTKPAGPIGRKVSGTALLSATKGRRRYVAGSLVGLSGAGGMGVGTHELLRRDRVAKGVTDRAEEFVRQGVQGNRDALRERMENSTKPAPAAVRAAAMGTPLAAGALGSAAAQVHFNRRRAQIGREVHGRHGLTAVASTGAGIAALPIANRLSRRHGYKVTPTGVQREKKAAVRPSKSSNVEIAPVRKAVADPGKNLSRGQKRALVTASGATPAIGPYAAAAQAGRLAPPDQRRKAAATQLGGTVAGATVGIVGGSQAAARAAARSPKAAARLNGAERRVGDAKIRALSKLPTSQGRKIHANAVASRGTPGRVMRTVSRVEARGGTAGKLVRPIARNPAAAAIGAVAGKAAFQAGGSQGAYTMTLNREKHSAYRSGRVTKAAEAPVMSRREQRDQLQRKRRNLGLSAAATAAGAGGVALLAGRELGPRVPGAAGRHFVQHNARYERAALGTAIAGGGIGAASGSANVRVQRRDLKAEAKQLGVEKALGRTPSFRASNVAMRRTRGGAMVAVRRANTVAKSIQTSVTPDEVKSYTTQYGTRGALPRKLDRDTRRKAYEARYVAAGGPKGEKWKNRADRADHVTGAGVAVGGLAGATELATRTKLAARAIKSPTTRKQIAHVSSRVGIAAGTGAAASELFHRHAQHRQSSYKHSPAGVAASALRRMQASDEE